MKTLGGETKVSDLSMFELLSVTFPTLENKIFEGTGG